METTPHTADIADLVTVTGYDGQELLIYRPQFESNAPTLTLYRWTGLSWPSYYEAIGAPAHPSLCYIDRDHIKQVKR